MTASNFHDPTRHFSQQLDHLLQATTSLFHFLSSSQDEAGLLKLALNALVTLTEAQCGQIVLFCDDMSHSISHGLSDALQTQLLQQLQQELQSGVVWPLRETYRIDAPHQHPSNMQLPLDTALIVPLYSHTNNLGRIYLGNKQDSARFTTSDEQLANNIASSLALALDYLQQRRAKEKAEEQIELHAKVFENSAEATIITDADCKILSINEAFMRITGFREKDVIGRQPSFLSPDKQNENFFQRMMQSLIEDGFWHGEVWEQRKNGDVFPAWLSISTIKNPQKELTHYVGLLSDVSERKQFQKQIQYLAYYDSLTDLPNRILFLDRVRQLISQHERTLRPFAILSINIDHFKNINETLSHSEGDKLLRQIASRLLRSIRTGDTAARLGGDKFGITLSNLKQVEDAVDAAEKILSTLALPFFVQEQEVFISASIGASTYPNDTNDAATLIKHAEAAMFHTKTRSSNSLQFYEPEIIANNNRRYQLESSLRRALANGEFELHYQPKINLGTMKISSVEALLRWHHPERGLIQPKEFISLLEETGQIIPIGKWIIESACAQINEWISRGIEPPIIAVNVSPKQFERDSFIRTIQEVLLNHACSAKYLEIEITESALMKDVKSASNTLQKLRDMGVHISVDDFGTGYSSLAYLSRFPIDTLKIDRTFIQDVTNNPNDATITRSVVDLAHNLGLRALAEGIETPQQLEFLTELGCDAGQGYIFSKPLPKDEFTQHLIENI